MSGVAGVPEPQFAALALRDAEVVTRVDKYWVKGGGLKNE
jgi:hypothetical protein